MTAPVPPPVDPSSSLGWMNEVVNPTATPPPQASDPAHLANGIVAPRPAPGPVGGGAFTVHPAHASQAARHLEVARDELQELRSEAVRLGRVSPPAQDQVSRDVASVLESVAVGGAGSLLAALDAGIQQLTMLIDDLHQDIRDYTSTEAANATRATDDRT